MTGPSAGRDPLRHTQRRARRPRGPEAALTRALRDRRLGGVAAGIAAFTGARPALVRTLFVAAVPLSLGIAALGYGLLWVLVPTEP